MLRSAVTQKSEGPKSENKVGLRCSAVNRKTFFPTEVTFGRLRRTSFKGAVLFFFLIEFDFLPRSLCPQFVVFCHNIQKTVFMNI